MEARILILALLIWVSACTKEEAKPTATGITPPPVPTMKITVRGNHAKPQFFLTDSDNYSIGCDINKKTNYCLDFISGVTLPYEHLVYFKTASVQFFFSQSGSSTTTTSECNWTDSSYLILECFKNDTLRLRDTLTYSKIHNTGHRTYYMQ